MVSYAITYMLLINAFNQSTHIECSLHAKEYSTAVNKMDESLDLKEFIPHDADRQK